MQVIPYLSLIAGDYRYLSIAGDYSNVSIQLSHLAILSVDPIPGLELLEIRGNKYWGFKLFDKPRIIRIKHIRKYITTDMITRLQPSEKIRLIGKRVDV